MSYNVENLFDTTHDQNKADFTYLPQAIKRSSPEVQAYCKAEKVKFYRDECFKIDWTEAKLNKKLDSLTRVVQTVANGQGPDILAVQEVENINVLNIWMQRGLRKLGYQQVILIEGPDKRGIDGAIISKFPQAAQPIYHDYGSKVSWPALMSQSIFGAPLATDKRGILEAQLSIDGKIVSVLSNHWPSQAHPSAERVAIAQTLASIGAKAAAQGRALISMGDYNTLDADQPNGIEELITDKTRPVYFYDSRAEYLMTVSARGSDTLPGSHWYRGEYSALDKILVLENTAGQFQPDWASFRTISESFMMERADFGRYKLKPKRFNFATAEGFADHLPIALDINI